ncbi:ketol-acid reductoisomerase [Ramicandelaber brevisporus]|nr:ketol-acid reductoisomerase [Ramicandelaber brevisporus]
MNPTSVASFAVRAVSRSAHTQSRARLTATRKAAARKFSTKAVAAAPAVRPWYAVGFSRATCPAPAPFGGYGAVAVQTRGMKTLDFGGVKETVWERTDFPPEKVKAMFSKDTMAMLGYGSQGRGQALNMKDNGLNVILGVRKDGASWKQAVQDGWVPGKDLFSVEEAAQKGTIVMNLLSDAAQVETWPAIKPFLTKGKTLYFAHGFGVVFHEQTGIIPPADIDVILCAPKGSGTTVRNLFLEGKGINASIAVHQDVSGQAREKAAGLGVAVGAGYIYETTFRKEVISDLVGERGALMGAIQGLFRAQYDVLRAKGHTPSEAWNETVEEATQSLYPLIGQKGMPYMYDNCSTTARRGALDWWKPFYDANKPVMEKLYAEVENGNEAARSIAKNSSPTYREELEAELTEIRNQELWRAGETARKLRPENN